MIDGRQVTYDIERCVSHVPDACRDCSHYTGTVGFECMEKLMSDALELLKEQQAEIERLKGEGKSPTWKKGKAFCGSCGGCLENKEMFSSYHVSSIRFCKWCGVPVDWSNE